MEQRSDFEVDEAFALLRRNGQPWLFVAQAVQIASSPGMARELVRWAVLGHNPPRELPPRPPMREWVTLYRGHRAVRDEVGAGLGLSAEFSASECLDAMRALSRMSRDEVAAEVAELSREEQESIVRQFLGVPFPPDDATLRALLDEFDADSQPDGPAEETPIDAFMRSGPGQFFFRVWWPCWVLYREYPPRLLRSARLGDLDALDRLLRLDKYILHDPVIARIVGDVMTLGAANNRKRIASALSGRPTVRLTDKAIRAGLGALISQLAFTFHTKVTAPEIQALFDAIERVRTGAPSDPKITATGESWSKAVQRHRGWPSLPTKPAGQ